MGVGGVHSTVCTCRTTESVGREGTLVRSASGRAKGRGIGVSLATPPKLRRLQEALSTKAKQEPAYRFYLLYDKVSRADILAHAYRVAKQRGGAPGVDGVTFEDIEGAGRERWLGAVGEEVRTETYRPQPVRRVLIPKPGGGERPLGIPTIRDRVVQTAALLILQPIFEADLEPTAYGYRPGHTALEAVQVVHRALCAGHTEVVDADVSQYFDTIPHADLMTSLARRISDRRMLRLLKRWLKAPVAEQAEGGGWRFSGGKRAVRGTPQGGVVSPLLANVYMNRYLKVFRLRGLDRRSGRRQARCRLTSVRFLPPPLSSRTVRFPQSGWKSKTYPQCGLPKHTGSLSGDAHPLPAPLVYPTGRWSLWSCKSRTPLSSVLASQAHPQPVFAQGSFTPEALPPFSATTSPCANPDASYRHFGVRRLIGGVLAACATHGWSSGPSRL